MALKICTTQYIDEANTLTHGESILNNSFFSGPLSENDPQVMAGINGELLRQRDQIEMIASENIVSKAVPPAQGAVLTNK